MNFEQLASEALHLPDAERAQLIRRLVSSLERDADAFTPDEWLAEAQRRADELDNDPTIAVSAEAVMNKARKLVE